MGMVISCAGEPTRFAVRECSTPDLAVDQLRRGQDQEYTAQPEEVVMFNV